MNAITLYRIGHWFHIKRAPILPSVIKNLMFIIFNSYIPPSASIGKGTIFAYGAIGVVLHANARIGVGCVIGQGVTIGASEGYASKEINKCPTIGSNCYIGAGAKILGDITIGSNCQIGASAVVLKSIPNNSVVVGIPARIIGSTSSEFRAIRP